MVFGCGLVLDLVVVSAIVAHLAHHEAGHPVAAACAEVVWAARRAGSIEIEYAVGGIGLDEVLLVLAPLETEFHLVRPERLVERKCQLPRVLALLVIAIRIASNVRVPGRVIRALIDEHGRHARKPVRIQVGWKSKLAQRICYAAGPVISADS